jgi:hypothetical protein
MPSRLVTKTLSRVPGLRRIPAAKLLVLGEIVVLARQHVENLDPDERRRLLALMRRARGRPRNLTARERAELSALVAKANPRLFIGVVADKLSPVPLPRWVVRGSR